jgi:hypothetical protein
MAEWLIAPVLKTGIVLGTIEGSNPSLSFCLRLWILSEILNFFKTHKNSYMRPLRITDLQYVVTNKKYEVSVSFVEIDHFH